MKSKAHISTSQLALNIATRLFTSNYGLGGGLEVLADRMTLRVKTKSKRERHLGGRNFSNAVHHIESELRKSGL